MAFRLILFIIFLFSFSANADQMCKPRADIFSLEGLQDFVHYDCLETKSSKECQDLYAKMKQNGEDPDSKGLVCSERNVLLRALEVNVDFRVGCAMGGWNFAVDTVKSVGTMIGEGAAKIAISAEKENSENAACDKDPAKKKAIFEDYNNSVPKMMRVEAPAEGVVQRSNCARLKESLKTAQGRQGALAMEKVRLRLDEEDSKYTPEEQEYVDWIKSMKGQGGGKLPNVIELAHAKLNEMGVKLQCYNTQEAAALTCEAIAYVATFAAGPAGAALKAARFSKIAKLAGVPTEKAIRAEAAAGALGREITEAQKTAIMKAHEVGKAEGRGYRTQGGIAGEYTKADLKKKSEILKEADFTKEERRILMETGITGQNPATTVGRADRTFMPTLNEAMARRSPELTKAASEEGIKYFKAKSAASPAEFKKTFPENDLSGVMEANYMGMNTDDSLKLAEKYFEVHGYNPDQGKLAVISQLRQETRYYQNAGSKVDSNISDYRIYRNKELEYKAWQSYYESRYPDRYNNLDYDRLSPGQRENLEKLGAEVEKLREAARRNKWPGYNAN